jgi:hypothetical protein
MKKLALKYIIGIMMIGLTMFSLTIGTTIFVWASYGWIYGIITLGCFMIFNKSLSMFLTAFFARKAIDDMKGMTTNALNQFR